MGVKLAGRLLDGPFDVGVPGFFRRPEKEEDLLRRKPGCFSDGKRH